MCRDPHMVELRGPLVDEHCFKLILLQQLSYRNTCLYQYLYMFSTKNCLNTDLEVHLNKNILQFGVASKGPRAPNILNTVLSCFLAYKQGILF